MKKYLLSFAVLAMAMSLFTACSKDDDNEDQPKQPEIVTVTPYHFDITVCVGQQGGMARKVTTIMQSVDSLNGNQQIDFRNQGGEINATYSMETILRGKYYYQVPFSADRFTKFEFKNDQVKVVQEQKFVQNTYATRNYTHAWENDSTLMIMAANGDKNAIVWTELRTTDMTILREGKLDINVLEGWDGFTTTGGLAYRQSDNRFFYFYYNKKGTGRKAQNEKFFHVVTVNATTMAVEKDVVNTEANEMVASAYGELLQQTIFFDEQDNLYIACFNDTDDGEMGCLLRIKKGETDFEKGYNAYANCDGKLLTTQYLGNGKVFCYSRNDTLTEDDGNGGTKAATAIDSYSHYYNVIDLNTKTRTRMAINGTPIDYSSGRFSQRSVFVPQENKVYFGVNTANAQPQVYIYDVQTGTVSEGVKIVEGYYFEQIRLVMGDPYTVTK